jgi:hypothetical protein
MQYPPKQVSPTVQAFQSSQLAPSGATPVTHWPVLGSQVLVRHEFHCDGGQTTGVPPVHTPAWQVSVWVQALPSLQVVPSGRFGTTQVWVTGSNTPGPWHSPAGAHVTGSVETQAPSGCTAQAKGCRAI